MSARSRGSSVGKLVERFESAHGAHGEAKRSEPKGHPLAFAFARWWRAVQPLEKLCQTDLSTKSEGMTRFEAKPRLPRPEKATKAKDAKAQEEATQLSCSTETPSQGQSSWSNLGSEALVVAARAFLANHRLDPSLDLLDRRIRLDADSDSESEARGARDVLAAAKLLARIQHLSGSLPDAFCSTLGELWTSPPQIEIQSVQRTSQSSWRESYDSMVLSETEKEDWQMFAEKQLESEQEVIKDQRDLLQLEQLQKEEMQKKIQDLEDALQEQLNDQEQRDMKSRTLQFELEKQLKQTQEQRDALQLEKVQWQELAEKLKLAEEHMDMLQLEKLQWEELEKKMKKTQERYEMLQAELEKNLQEQRDLLQLEKLQCEELQKKLKKTQEVGHKEHNKVEVLEVQVDLLSKENAELHSCRDQLSEVLCEKKVLLDALAVNEALTPKDEVNDVLREASDSATPSGAAALRSAAAVLTDLRVRLAKSEAKRQQLQQQCEKLEERNGKDLHELQRYRDMQRDLKEGNDENDSGVLSGHCLPDQAQESINLPHEVMSAADLAAHLRRGGEPLRAQASQEVAHCQELTKRLHALQKDRDAMAVEVREALTLCGRAARAARTAQEPRMDAARH